MMWNGDGLYMVTGTLPPVGLQESEKAIGSQVRETKSRKTGRHRGDRIAGMLFVLPASIFIFAFMLFPMLYSGYLSFTKYNFVKQANPSFIGFENFARAVQDPVVLKAFRNTAVYAGFYFVIVMVLSLAIAMMLFQKLKFNTFYRSAIFMPIVVPLSLAGLIFVWILQPNYGLLNHLLANVLGMPELAKAWLSDGTTAMAAIVVLSLWATTGFMTILFLSGLQSISTEILEAGRIDGAGDWRMFTDIIVPSLRPTFVITGTWAILHALKVFVEPMVLTDGGPGISTLVMYQHIYTTAFQYFDMGYASALGYLLGALILSLIGVNYVISMWKADRNA